MDEQPLVSVLMRNYNQERFINWVLPRFRWNSSPDWKRHKDSGQTQIVAMAQRFAKDEWFEEEKSDLRS